MQNLTLQTTQNTSLKKMSDSANKTNANADNAALAEIHSPFQKMLNKQVQAQQAPAKQPAAKPVVEPKQKNAANKSDVAQEAIDDKARLKPGNHESSTANIKKTSGKSLSENVDSALNPSAAFVDQVKLDSKGLLKSDGETKASDAIVNVADANTNNLAASPLALAMNVIPFVNTQAASLDANATTQTPLTTDGATQNQRNLDAVLDNALQQSKSANLPDMSAQDAQDAKMPSDQNGWLDSMLPSAAKQALGDESSNAKLVLNALKDGAAKEIISKDAAIKEITMPTSYQPAAQINTAVTTQQLGSANSINVYPGKTGWDQAISQKVVWMVGAGEQSATLTLNPPDLGPLQVVIHVHNDQANTTFISDNAEVRQALQDGMSNLRDKMSESGIQLGQANVSSGEQSQQQFQQDAQRLGTTQLGNNNAGSTTEKTSTAHNIVRVSNGLVDTFA